jgi:hypothetical protein
MAHRVDNRHQGYCKTLRTADNPMDPFESVLNLKFDAHWTSDYGVKRDSNVKSPWKMVRKLHYFNLHLILAEAKWW